ncbi:UNVERIFIED_CONTAM: hypothetical protein FKN15_016382 [Acipenser sinensis]
MDFQELIEKIKRNTAAQEEQNKKWRVELGLPEPEPTELDLLLQKWEKELPLPEPRGEELPLLEPRGEELPLPEPRGEELPLPEPRGEELPLPEPREEKLPLPEPRGEELPLPEPRGEELPLPEPRREELPLPEPRGEELPLPEPRGEELPLPEPRGEELPLPEPREEELSLLEPRGEELPLPEPRGEELPLPEPKGEEAKSIPPPQPRPPPLETSPALLDAVSWPGLVGLLGGMPGPPSSCPSSQVTGLPGTVACLVPHSAPPNGTDVTTWESDVACAPPSPTLFPLRPQSSLRWSIGAHLCLPFLAPGRRSALRSPWASHLGPSSLDRGPFLWAPDFKGGECGLGMADQCCALKGGKCNTAGRGLILPAWKKTCANAHWC